METENSFVYVKQIGENRMEIVQLMFNFTDTNVAIDDKVAYDNYVKTFLGQVC